MFIIDDRPGWVQWLSDFAVRLGETLLIVPADDPDLLATYDAETNMLNVKEV